MSPGEFLLCAFSGDTNVPPAEYPAQIKIVNLVDRTVDCRLDDGRAMTADYSPGESAPWPASTPDGSTYMLERHDIFVPQNADPSVSDVALLSFSDGAKALGFVESIGETTNIQLYQQPYPRLT